MLGLTGWVRLAPRKVCGNYDSEFIQPPLIDIFSLLLLCGGYISPFRFHNIQHTDNTVDTVEKNILDLAARQGLSLYTKDNAIGVSADFDTLAIVFTYLQTVNVGALATDETIDAPQKAATQKGDFIFK